MTHFENTAKLIKRIKKGANICIYGSNDIAIKIYELIKKYRKDIAVQFFLDSNKNGQICKVPIYRPTEVFDKISKIDSAIVASYSSGYYLELILSSMRVKNIIKIDKKSFDEVNSPINNLPDIRDILDIFNYREDKELYKLLVEYRFKNRDNKRIKKYFEKNHHEIIKGHGSNNSYSIKHYFEYIKPEKIQTVIDAGAYDGLFSLMFLKKFPNCQKVYSFEPCYESFKAPILDDIIKRENRIEIIPKGLWSKQTKIEFREELEAKVGSGIVSVKTDFNRPQKIISIDTDTIDNFAANKDIKIDFIKMDIENSEMNALKGALKTITAQRPQLAISIYHTNEQFLDIPVFLAKNLKDYIFRLGHYSTGELETVLYAIPTELC